MSSRTKKTFKNITLITDLGKFYLNASLSDVNFIISSANETQKLPAHKLLLAAKSDVFEAMFFGELKEQGDVKIVDATIDAFEQFLQFFYCAEVNLTMVNVFNVMYLGKKYNITACLDACQQFLKDNLSFDNVCFVYDYAILYDQTQLKQRCEWMIKCNLISMFGSTDFLQCSRYVLNHILEFDDLCCEEPDLFEACMSWVKAASKLETLTHQVVQKYLGDSFHKIRFKSMTIEEFAKIAAKYGDIFTVAEYKEIVQLIGSKGFVPEMFTAKVRQGLEVFVDGLSA